MKILSIETSCDETSVAVVENGRRVLSNIVASQVEQHKLYGGVVPEIASRLHCESIVGVCDEALSAAKITLDDIDAVAVTYAPGLIGALLVGVNFAKGIALARGLPLIPVHHIRAHIASIYLTRDDLKPPFLALAVSGGHTSLIHVKGYTEFSLIGQTLDDAAGEAFDKVARVLGLPYPGGIHIDRLANQGGADKAAFALPRPKTAKPHDFSFSGLKTAVVNLVHNRKQSGRELTQQEIADLSASFQHTVCDILANKCLGAAEQLRVDTIAVVGGVAANSGLRAALGGALFPPLSLCGDNGAMVGCQAYYELLAGNIADSGLNAAATMGVERGKEVGLCPTTRSEPETSVGGERSCERGKEVGLCPTTRSEPETSVGGERSCEHGKEVGLCPTTRSEP